MDRKKWLFIKKTATLQNTFLLTLFFLIMAFFIMPEAAKQIKQYAPEADLIDTLFYYFPDQLYELISAYGEKGRDLYIVVELSADLVFSVVIAALFSLLMICSASKLQNNSQGIKLFLGLPISTMVVNWLENGCIVWILWAFPEKHFYLALVASFFTCIKWLLIAVCLGIILWNFGQLAVLKFSFFQKTQTNDSIAKE